MRTKVEMLRQALKVEELVEWGTPLGIDEKWLREAAERNFDEACEHVNECADIHYLHANGNGLYWPALESFVKNGQIGAAHAHLVHLWSLYHQAERWGVLNDVCAAIHRNEVRLAESIIVTHRHSREVARVISFCQKRIEELPNSRRAQADAALEKIKREKYGTNEFGAALLEFERITRV